MSIDAVKFDRDSIRFGDYPFPPAAVFPDGCLDFESIREVSVRSAPPEVRTHTGEILFISANHVRSLEKAVRRNSLPVVERVDIWHHILSSFLDTETDDGKALAVLHENRISENECRELREFVAPAMRAYNCDSGLWDWTHLGLYDVLCALVENGPEPACHAFVLPRNEFELFYRRAMVVAGAGAVIK